MKIYFAGEIRPGDWREQIVKPEFMFVNDSWVNNMAISQSEGMGDWPVRFTGSEIFRDVGDCVQQVINIIAGLNK